MTILPDYDIELCGKNLKTISAVYKVAENYSIKKFGHYFFIIWLSYKYIELFIFNYNQKIECKFLLIIIIIIVYICLIVQCKKRKFFVGKSVKNIRYIKF